MCWAVVSLFDSQWQLQPKWTSTLALGLWYWEFGTGKLCPQQNIHSNQADNGHVSDKENASSDTGGFFRSLLAGLARDFFRLLMSFVIGTAAGAVVCWYTGIPIILAVLGGILVLALALAIASDSSFF